MVRRRVASAMAMGIHAFLLGRLKNTIQRNQVTITLTTVFVKTRTTKQEITTLRIKRAAFIFTKFIRFSL